MATTPETWIPSRRMQSAAVAERERVEQEMQRLEARAAELTRELAAVRATQTRMREELHALNRFVHSGQPAGNGLPHLQLISNGAAAEDGDTEVVLRGGRIREMAVRVLVAAPEGHGPVHYRTWFELFTRQGFLPAGKDPLATFHTQIGRSSVVRRTTTSGVYELDLSVPERLRERLDTLHEQLRATHDIAPDTGVEAIAAARERRAKLTAEVDAAERALEEALRSLGETAPGESG